MENSAGPARSLLLRFPRHADRRAQHRTRRRDRLRERARLQRAAARTRIALRLAALYKQRLGIRNGEDLRARKNGGENVMLRAQRTSNRNKNGISQFRAVDAALCANRESRITSHEGV